MNININLGNVQENITSAIIVKLYEVATAVGNTVQLSGNLYSPTGYAYQIDYLNLTFGPNFTLTVPETGKYIYFEDSEVERVLKANNVSSDGIGISGIDASTASLGLVFKNNTTITSFDEFRYFTAWNTSSYSFEGCTSLKSISLSSTAVAIPYRAFYGCSSLETLSNANSVTTVNQDAFSGTQLPYLSQLPNLTTLNLYAFRNGGAGEWDITGMSSVDDNAFYMSNITSLKYRSSQQTLNLTRCINLLHIDTDIENWTIMPSFLGCSSLLPFVIYQPNVTTVTGTGIFALTWAGGRADGPTNWSHIYWPNIKNFYHSSIYFNNGNDFRGIFSSGRFTGQRVDLVYLKDVEKIDFRIFCGTTVLRLVINKQYSNKPVIVQHSRDTVDDLSEVTKFDVNPPGAIYVPDSSLSDYQSDSVWGQYPIKSMNELIRYTTEADWKAAGSPAASLITAYM